jgi:hypothetical protein
MRCPKVRKGIDETQMFSPMTRGDRMNSKSQENGAFQWTVWVVGSASLLLLFSAGLELFVQRRAQQCGRRRPESLSGVLVLCPGLRPLVCPLPVVARAEASWAGDTIGRQPICPCRTEELGPRKARAGRSSIPPARGRYWCSDPIGWSWCE